MTTFADLATRGSLLLNDGYRTKASELGIPGFPVLRVAEIADGTITPTYGDHVRYEYRDKIAYKLSRTGDVLLTTKGTVGRRAIMPELRAEFAYSPQLCFFRILDDTIDNRWLYYWLGGSEFWNQALGVSQQTDMAPYISLRDLRAVEIKLPPIDDQRAIAATLGAVDEKIESNRRLVQRSHELLDAMAVGWCGSLAKTNLGSLSGLTRATVSPAAMGDDIVDHYSLPAFDISGRPERVPASAIMSQKIGLKGSSVLVSRLNPRTNRTWWAVPQGSARALASTEFAVLSAPTEPELTAIWLAVRHPSFLRELPRRVTGTSGSHQRVRPDDMLAIEVPDVRQIDGAAKAAALTLLQLALQRREESARLSDLRNTLLPELLSGRIPVPVAAAVVHDVLKESEKA